ncbi:hypothetical protein CHELA1G11_10631 [Hyphomicrobiales bacterium]|nr:hypothetical protein CHELA1G11_10631 [Hyphomicrobiales bacterium]
MSSDSYRTIVPRQIEISIEHHDDGTISLIQPRDDGSYDDDVIKIALENIPSLIRELRAAIKVAHLRLAEE